MSPIDPKTVHVERWTETKESTFQSPGNVRIQILAEGDEKDPGSYVLVRKYKKR